MKTQYKETLYIISYKTYNSMSSHKEKFELLNNALIRYNTIQNNSNCFNVDFYKETKEHYKN